MKTRFYLVYAMCALLQSCNMVDAQVVWLSTKNPDFTNCDSEVRDVPAFNAVSNTCPFDVFYEQSDEQYVIVDGDEEYFDKINTVVKRGKLEISVEPNRYRNVRLRVRVGSPEISELNMAGSGSIICTSDIESSEDLTIILGGSGDIVAKKIVCDRFESTLSGSGDIRVERIDAGNVRVSVAGSGDWGASLINAVNLKVTVAGSGDLNIAEAQVEKDLEASVAGSGDIRVNGRAHNANARVVGSGDISGRLHYDNISKIKSGTGDINW